LAASGLKLAGRLEAVAASLDRAATKDPMGVGHGLTR
jgi:hypothetical protein